MGIQKISAKGPRRPSRTPRTTSLIILSQQNGSRSSKRRQRSRKKSQNRNGREKRKGKEQGGGVKKGRDIQEGEKGVGTLEIIHAASPDAALRKATCGGETPAGRSTWRRTPPPGWGASSRRGSPCPRSPGGPPFPAFPRLTFPPRRVAASAAGLSQAKQSRALRSPPTPGAGF